MKEEMKLCWVPLGALIKINSKNVIVAGNPTWSDSNGWYGGGSTNTGLKLIDSDGRIYEPSSLSVKVTIVANHWSDIPGLITTTQRMATGAQCNHPSVAEQKTKKPIVKLNPYI